MASSRETYAKGTRVPVGNTKTEIERLLIKYKARATAFFANEDGAAVAFEMQERRVMFKISLPAGDAPKAQQGRRERWRALLLSIKAKLVSVDSGIETFEEAFMAHVVMPDGQTVADHVRPRIESAYKEGKMLPLLPGPSRPQ
jgi:hypothetical protein